MATSRFTTTASALKDVKNLPADQAIKNIEGWEEYLGKHDHEGVKAVAADLTKLKKLLSAESLDNKAITTLLHKLGKDTTKVASAGDLSNTKHIEQIGEALSAVK